MNCVEKTKRKVLFYLVIAALVLAIIPTAAFAASLTDIVNHWARDQINDWVGKGWVKGYSDGKFRPNDKITRAEFMALVNRAFGYTNKADIIYEDVPAGAWFAEAVAKAKAAGYLTGYSDGTIKPNQPISRQEVVVVIMKIKSLKPNAPAADKFKDAGSIPGWSKEAVGAAAAANIISGYPDKTFKGENSITRAEAVAALSKALAFIPVSESVTYDKAGTYGPATGTQVVKGNVTITADGVTLQNMNIEGNLVLAKGIAEGNVTLNKVIVNGSTDIRGGGVNSIIILDSTLGKVTVAKENGKIRILISGSTTVGKVVANSGLKLEEKNLAGEGFKEVVIDASKDDKIILAGTFDTVVVLAEGLTIEVPAGTTVKTLTLDKATKVIGQGTVQKAEVNANGVSFEKEPAATKTASGITGPTITPAPATGGGSSGGTDRIAPTLASCLPADNAIGVAVDAYLVLTFSENITAVSGKNITIKKTADDVTAWTLAANDARVTVSGKTVNIDMPNNAVTDTGYYVLIDDGAFKDIANNDYAGISDKTNWNFTTVDTIAPAASIQGTVATDDIINIAEKAAGFGVTARSTEAGGTLYIAPQAVYADAAALIAAAAGSHAVAGANQDTVITVAAGEAKITDAATFAVYAVDATGNLSPASNETFGTDLTAPAFISSVVEAATPRNVEITFSEVVRSSTVLSGGFTIKTDNIWRGVQGEGGNESNKLTFMLHDYNVVAAGQAVTIEYDNTAPLSELADPEGNPLLTFGAQAVTNHSTRPAAPEIVSEVAAEGGPPEVGFGPGDTLRITFNVVTNKIPGTVLADKSAVDGVIDWKGKSFGSAYSGVWTDNKTLVITADTIDGANFIVGDGIGIIVYANIKTQDGSSPASRTSSASTGTFNLPPALPANLINSITASSINEAGDTIIVAFSTMVLKSTAENQANWIVRYADNNSGLNAVPLPLNHATFSLDNGGTNLTVTLDEVLDQVYIPDGKYISVVAANENVLTPDYGYFVNNADVRYTVGPVTAENASPQIVSDWAWISNTEFTITYSEVLNRAAAENPANWLYDNPTIGFVPISSASLSADGKTVTIHLSNEVVGSATLEPNSQVRDLAGNAVTPSSYTESIFPDPAQSGITSQTPGASGSRQVTLTIELKNLHGANLPTYVQGDFSATFLGTPFTFTHPAYFSNFINLDNGRYTIVFTGPADNTGYDFTNLTVGGVVIEAGPTTVTTP